MLAKSSSRSSGALLISPDAALATRKELGLSALCDRSSTFRCDQAHLSVSRQKRLIVSASEGPLRDEADLLETLDVSAWALLLAFGAMSGLCKVLASPRG